MKKQKNFFGFSLLIAPAFFMLGGCQNDDENQSGSVLKIDPASYESRRALIDRPAGFENIKVSFDALNSHFKWVEALYQTLLFNDDSNLVGEAIACINSGGTFTEKVSYDDINDVERYEEIYNFNNCGVSIQGFGEYVLNGTWIRTQESLSDLSVERTDIRDSIDLHGTKGGDVALKIRSRINVTDDYYPDDRTWSDLVSVEVFEYLLGSQYVALKSTKARTDLTSKDTTYHLDGTLVSSNLDGFVTVSTPKDIANLKDVCPTQGILNFSANGAVGVQFGADTDVVLTINGNRYTDYDSCESFNRFFVSTGELPDD
jgi:hypothetical protein